MLTLLPLLGLCALVHSHFVLTVPARLGYEDSTLDQAPCGGFDPTVRDTVTDFAVRGSPVGLITTHSGNVWEFRAALASDLTNWIPLTNFLSQDGLGEFCEPHIPARRSWIGQDAVLQVVQQTHHGNLYQCAAIKFVKGGPAPTPADCVNGTDISAVWL